MRFIAALLLGLWPLTLWGQSFPALYDVTGVASNDVLNVRAYDSAGSDIIGALAPNATGVEVVRLNDNGRWGLVNTHEWSGWASMRFLRRQAGQEGWAFPARASCYGTEPFWDLNLWPGGPVEYSRAGDPTSQFSLRSQGGSANRPDRYSFLADRAGTAMIGVIARQACNDGMSDREFGLTLELMLWKGAALEHVSGCCSLAR